MLIFSGTSSLSALTKGHRPVSVNAGYVQFTGVCIPVVVPLSPSVASISYHACSEYDKLCSNQGSSPGVLLVSLSLEPLLVESFLGLPCRST